MLPTFACHSLKSSKLLLDAALRRICASRRLVRVDVRRKLICFALISSLLLLPGPGIGLNEVRALASTAVDFTTSPVRFLHPILKSLFGFGARSRPLRETLADRIARVSHVRISPSKLVGYAGEGATFVASPTDSSDRTIQGVKFDWESSDTGKLQIDEAGRATFLQPGRVWITCRAGNASGTAPVLIRPGHRPVQSDQDWRNDQNGLDASGNVVGHSGGSIESTVASAGTIINTLLDKLTPAASAQVYPDFWAADRQLLYEKIPEQTATINDGTGTMWSCAYAYTEYGAVKKKIDARGVESHYLFDALHQVTQIWYTGLGGDDSGYVRPALPSGVAATGDVGFAYSNWGELSGVTISSPGGIGYPYTETYAFDGFKRPMSVTRTIPDHTLTNWKTYTTSYEYNLGSQFSKITYPSGQQVAVNHDDKGRTQSLTHNPGDASGYLTGMTYNTAGQVTGLTLGNGVVETYGYDGNRFQLTSQTAVKGASSRMNLTYGYQASAGQMGAGSTTGNASQLMGISGTINLTTESAAYTYDNLGRLATSNQTSNGSSAQRRFAYDRWGNRAGVWDTVSGGNQLQSITLEQSGGAPTNRITSVTSGSTLNYSYDAAGNVTNDGVHSYSYDAENRLVSVDGGATAQYKYDHQNRRVTKIVGSAWTHYIWEGDQVIGEHDATTPYSTNPTYQVKSARLDYIYTGGRMIQSRQRTSSTAPWTTMYYLSDRLSVRMTLDSSGNVLGRQAHQPFGEDFAESGSQDKHHFTSYERDAEIALDQAINRSYAPTSGRFRSNDPSESSGTMEDPQTWHRFSYTLNDPVNSLDPQGLDSVPVVPGNFGHPRPGLSAASTLSCSITANFVPFLPMIGNYPAFYTVWPSHVSRTVGFDETFRDGPRPGFWLYKFEVFIVYPGISTVFNQFFFAVGVVNDDSWVGKDVHTGKKYPFHDFEPFHDDAPGPGFWQSTPSSANFVDTPAFAKKQKRKVKKGGKTKLTPVHGIIRWTFTFQGFDSLGTIFCEKKVRLTFTFSGSSRSWEWTPVASG